MMTAHHNNERTSDMPKQDIQLLLDRCPHCLIAKPNLEMRWNQSSTDHAGQKQKTWATYRCATCGGIILTSSPKFGENVNDIYPKQHNVSEAVPERARSYLEQAIESLHAPAGAVMLTACALDAMLKEKGYTEKSLYQRIEKAADDHLITREMSEWAHEIRLDANDQRHADDNAPLPNEADARKAIEFTKALAQFLFVLPARVERGRKNAKQ